MACTSTYRQSKGNGSISSYIFVHLQLCLVVSAILGDLLVVPALTVFLGLGSPVIVVIVSQPQDEYNHPGELRAC
jgi:hypothetical protein